MKDLEESKPEEDNEPTPEWVEDEDEEVNVEVYEE